jgi:hypothetical protein
VIGREVETKKGGRERDMWVRDGIYRRERGNIFLPLYLFLLTFPNQGMYHVTSLSP